MEPTVEACVLSSWWGQQLDSDCRLWFLTITWWGRLGKLLGVTGFVAVIFELIGHERLKKYGDTLRGWTYEWIYPIETLEGNKWKIVLVVIFTLLQFVPTVGRFVNRRIIASVLIYIAWGLSHNRLGVFIKVATALLLFVGLFLDLLSS